MWTTKVAGSKMSLRRAPITKHQEVATPRHYSKVVSYYGDSTLLG